jgi:hypothetical protein
LGLRRCVNLLLQLRKLAVLPFALAADRGLPAIYRFSGAATIAVDIVRLARHAESVDTSMSHLGLH